MQEKKKKPKQGLIQWVKILNLCIYSIGKITNIVRNGQIHSKPHPTNLEKENTERSWDFPSFTLYTFSQLEYFVIQLKKIQITTKNKIGNHSKIYVYFQKLITINVILIFLIFLYMAVCVFKEEKAMAPHSSTLAWEIPWAEEPGRLQSMGSLRVGHNWATSLSLFTFMHWRRKWQPTPVFLPGESQGRGNLVGCRLWGHTESDRLKWLSSSNSV